MEQPPEFAEGPDPEIEAARNSTVDQRVNNSNWKVRKDVYDEIAGDPQKLQQSDEMNEICGLLGKIAGESANGALLSALECVNKMLENFGNMELIPYNDIIHNSCNKGFGNSRDAIRDKTIDILLICIYEGHKEEVISELSENLGSKNPKIVAAALKALTKALKTYGTSQITPDIIIKVLKKPGLLDHKDINVKKEGKALAVELYTWIGNVVPEMLKTLNEQLLKDLTVAFEAVKGQDQPEPVKRIRSMEGVMIKEQDNDNGIQQQQQSGSSSQLSVYDFTAPQEVLSQIAGKQFNLFNDLKAEGKKAWEVKRDALEKTAKIIQNAGHLKEGNYSELYKALKVCVGDAQVNVQVSALNVFMRLCEGLKKRCGIVNQAKIMLASSVGLLTSKNLQLIRAVAPFLIVLATNTLSADEVLCDSTLNILHEKPNLTQKLQLFPVIKTLITHPQVIQTFSPIGMRVLGQHLVQVVNQDTDQTIRDQAAQVIGVLSQITGIDIIEALIKDLPVPK
ncbi:MAG: putative Cytoskeleton-associated protein 5 [Streblomastix strix]|uniref:Putative Cytoskeleton-associated protein 5 n=1 Tax=Streblomastix strix TaxID=222440 RepID=A0A5J4USI2_9EUKA|nr:MAG: putative Cytoskeleton-associated protein 5 [Streblomastix strix]